MAVQLISKLGEWDLPDGDLILGRHSTADLCIDDARLSRRHAEFRVSGPKVSVKDLGSVNGILVNGDKIDGDQELSDGDLIVIGPIAFTLKIDPNTAANASITERRSNKNKSSEMEFMPQTDRQARATVNMDSEDIVNSALAPVGADGMPLPTTGYEEAGDSTRKAEPIAVGEQTGTDQLLPDQSAKVRTDALLPKDPSEARASEFRSFRSRRLLATIVDPQTTLVIALLLALPLAAGGLAYALHQAGIRQDGEQLTLAGSGDAMDLGDLAVQFLMPGTWTQLPSLVLTLHGDHRQQFVIFFVAITLAILAVVLTVLFYLIAATMIRGAPFWHRRLNLVIRETGTGYFPVAWRSVVRWLILLALWPVSLVAIIFAVRGPEDVLAGCQICRHEAKR